MMSNEPTLKRILIFDDDADLRQLLLVYLKKMFEGVELEEYDPIASGAPDESFDWSRYDVLILDYFLCIHGITGLDILHANRKNPDFPAAIMLTGAGNEEVAVRALRAGVYDYLRKQSLDKQVLKDSILNAYTAHDKEKERKKESTQQGSAFNKSLFYQQLELHKDIPGYRNRVFLHIELADNQAIIESEGIILRDNIVRHIAKQSFEIFNLGECNPSITRLGDTAVALIIDMPDSRETLEYNLNGLLNHLKKRPFNFDKRKIEFSVNVGAIELSGEGESKDEILAIARSLSKLAAHSKTERFRILTADEWDSQNGAGLLANEKNLDLENKITAKSPRMEEGTSAEQVTLEKTEPHLQKFNLDTDEPEFDIPSMDKDEHSLLEEAPQQAAPPDTKADVPPPPPAKETPELKLADQSPKQAAPTQAAPPDTKADVPPPPPVKETPELKLADQPPKQAAPAQPVPPDTKADVPPPPAKQKPELKLADQPPKQAAPAQPAPPDKKADVPPPAKETPELKLADQPPKQAAPAQPVPPDKKADVPPPAKEKPELILADQAPKQAAPAQPVPRDVKADVPAKPAPEDTKSDSSSRAPVSENIKPSAKQPAHQEPPVKPKKTLEELKAELEKAKIEEVSGAVDSPAPQETERPLSSAAEEINLDIESLDEDNKNLFKAFEEKRIILSYTPVISLLNEEVDSEDEIHFVGLQQADTLENSEEDLISNITSKEFKLYIDRWILREIIGSLSIKQNVTDSYIIKISDASIGDASFFNWIRAMLTGLDSKNLGKYISLEINADHLDTLEKQARALISYLRKTHNFSFVLGNVTNSEGLFTHANHIQFDMVRCKSILIKELHDAPLNSNEVAENAENATQSQLDLLKSKHTRFIADDITDATALTDTISSGTEYAMGEFIGEPVTQMDDATNIESFEIV